MQRLLDAHPEVVCSGEGHFIEELWGPLLKLRGDYNTKQALVAERVYEGKPYYPEMGLGDMAAVGRSLIVRRMSARATPQTKAIGDKTPRYTQHLVELERLFREARFINVVRHPYDVTVSRLHHGVRAGVRDALAQGHRDHRLLVRNAAGAWSVAQARVAAFRPGREQKLRQVRYEDLLADAGAVAAELYRFLGVSDAPELVAAAVQASSFEALSGRKPGEEDKTSFFRKGIAGDWRGSLDKDDLKVVDDLCGELMRAEGYQRADEEEAAA